MILFNLLCFLLSYFGCIFFRVRGGLEGFFPFSFGFFLVNGFFSSSSLICDSALVVSLIFSHNLNDDFSMQVENLFLYEIKDV